MAFASGVTVAVALGIGVVTTANAGQSQNADLAEFYGQELDWKQCEEPEPWPPSEQPDDGIIIDPWKGQWKHMECATAIVPVDYENPEDGRLRIEVSRIKAKDSEKRQGVLLFNPGGPGGGGLSMPLPVRDTELAESFDLIGFDPRGVGRSSGLFCERIDDPRPDTTRPTDEQFAAYTQYAKEREAACERGGGGIRPFINTANTARDMDVIRAALDEKKINYVGYSYGTYLGAVYGSLFPEGLNRSVLDSSIHPDWLWREQGLQQSVGVRFNVEEWATWVGERDGTFGLGTSKDEVLATTEALTEKLADESVPLDRERPEDWPFYWPREFDGDEMDIFLAQTTQQRPVWDVVAEVVGELRTAAEDGTALSKDTSDSVGRLLSEQGIGKIDPGVYDTVTCEADWPSDPETYYEDMRRYREQYPYHDRNGSGVIGAAPTNCTFRGFTPPEPLVSLERDGYPAGIVIQGDGDPATQYAGGPEMADTLGNHLISVRDSGGHGHYGSNPCVTERVDDYLINGVLPPSRSECAAEPRPSVPADDAPDAPADAGAQERSDVSKDARVREASANRSIWQVPARM
ncbi:alpha/beta hydrolase [Prauserella cavernicola]|uniref:Alpha/beta fold hydrolase n=1 Tax=Prauserella cavernicola TaxID=2800127 RepID=A0A934QP80_9PSEU|nr:alpha/beta hydrolase [Prauserella cavernicola]MBK1783855.1 alpha/beta fold hydrolase [Prauserella cavernicola]